jgi:hypothetical protein
MCHECDLGGFTDIVPLSISNNEQCEEGLANGPMPASPGEVDGHGHSRGGVHHQWQELVVLTLFLR